MRLALAGPQRSPESRDGDSGSLSNLADYEHVQPRDARSGCKRGDRDGGADASREVAGIPLVCVSGGYRSGYKRERREEILSLPTLFVDKPTTGFEPVTCCLRIETVLLSKRCRL